MMMAACPLTSVVSPGPSRRETLTFSLAGAFSVLGGCSSQAQTTWTARRGRDLLEEVVSLVERHHYLSGSDTPGWQAWGAGLGEARARATAATSWDGVYFGALWPLLQRLGDTHTSVARPQSEPATPSGAQPSDPPAPERLPGAPWQGDINAGLGFRMAPSADGVTVYGVVQGSQADRHAIEPGSVLLDYSLSSRGSASPLFRARVRAPDGQTSAVEYSLDTVTAAPEFASSQTYGGLSVRFDRFEAGLVQRTVEVLRASTLPVILDLRLNVGGDLQALRTLMGALAGPDQLIGTMMAARAHQTVLSSGGPPIGRPMAVLVGPGTQSAAEVCAEALRHHGVARLVGSRTAGQVLAATTYTLSDGGRLHVATHNFIAASGRRLEQNGVEPDILVRESLKDLRTGHDVVAEAAARVISSPDRR